MRKLATLIAVALPILLLAACGNDDDGGDSTPFLAPTPMPVMHAQSFLVQAQELESMPFEVKSRSQVRVQWESLNAKCTTPACILLIALGGKPQPVGSPGDINASLTCTGCATPRLQTWNRRVGVDDPFEAEPGRYQVNFDNTISTVTAKSVMVKVTITPQSSGPGFSGP